MFPPEKIPSYAHALSKLKRDNIEISYNFDSSSEFEGLNPLILIFSRNFAKLKPSRIHPKMKKLWIYFPNFNGGLRTITSVRDYSSYWLCGFSSRVSCVDHDSRKIYLNPIFKFKLKQNFAYFSPLKPKLFSGYFLGIHSSYLLNHFYSFGMSVFLRTCFSSCLLCRLTGSTFLLIQNSHEFFNLGEDRNGNRIADCWWGRSKGSWKRQRRTEQTSDSACSKVTFYARHSQDRFFQLLRRIMNFLSLENWIMMNSIWNLYS